MEAPSFNLICETEPFKLQADLRTCRFLDLLLALNLEGSVPQIKLGEAASIAFEKHPLKRASVFP